MLKAIRIILVSPSHPGNIGSTARAMRTMGISELHLVNPLKFPDQKAYEMGSGADDILNNAVIHQDLASALHDCACVIGTSARPRHIDLPGLTPEACAQKILSASPPTAIVFGREHAGLTNEELMHCQYHVTIPTVPDYCALNLSQAVQIIAYELFKQQKKTTTQQPITSATHQELTHFYQHLESTLLKLDFLKSTNIKNISAKLKRLYAKANLEKKEVSLLRGIFTAIDKKIQ